MIQDIFQTKPAGSVNPGSSNWHAVSAWKSLLVLFIFALVVSAAGHAVFQHYKEKIQSDKQSELGGIARLKTQQIGNWMRHRSNDAQMFRSDPLFLAEAERWLQQGGPAGAARAKLLERLVLQQHSNEDYGFTSISLFDDKAVLRLSSYAREAPIQGVEKARLLESMQSGAIVFSDIHREKLDSGQRIEIELRAPLIVHRNGKARAIGAILFRIDPYRFIFPLIQGWPTPSQSAENILVRRDGDEVVFLNELRFRKNTPLDMRFPLGQQQLLATQAVTGQEGLVDGEDYRDVPVVGVISRVPGTSWFMISKMDKAEIFSPIYQFADGMFALMLALAGMGSGLAFFWRRGEKKRYEGELQRLVLEKHLDLLARYANDIIILLDDAGHVADFNDRALEALGYSPEEMQRMHLDHLRAIDFTPSPAERFRQIEEAGGALIFESVLVRRNGENFPVEVSVRRIEVGGRKFYQAIIRDITERKRSESELVRQRKFIRQVIDSDPSFIFVKDAAGRFLLANEAMARCWGMSPEELVGKVNSDFVADPELRESYDRAVQEVIETRTERRGMDVAVLPNGEKRWYQTIRKPLEQESGSVSVLTIGMDITELKQAEEELQRLNRALRLLGSCNAALVHAVREDELLAEVCRLIVESGGYLVAWVGLAEHDEGKTVRPAAHYGDDQGYLQSVKISWADTELGRGPTGTAIRTGLTQVNHDSRSDSMMAPWRDALLARGFCSSISFCLNSGEEALGALTIYAGWINAFGHAEVKLLEELAGDLAFGMAALRTRNEHDRAVQKLRQSEEHLQFSNALLTAANETSIDGMLVVDAAGQMISFNRRFVEMWGIPEEVVESRSDERAMKAVLDKIVDQEKFLRKIWHLYRHTHEKSRDEIALRDGRVFERYTAPLVGAQGRYYGRVWYFRDITERKQAEARLEEQKTFLHQIIDTDPNLIYVKDAAGRFIMVNQALANFYGLSIRQMIGKSDATISLERKGLTGYLEPDTELFRGGHDVIRAESSMTVDGQQSWYLTIKKPLPQPDGSLNVLGIAVDITGQKLSEMWLAESYGELQRLAAHLENVKEEERTRIARELHDEMGATLAALKMRAAWLASKLPAELPLLREEVGHISTLVSEGIATVRQVVGKLRPTLLEDVGLGAAIENYVGKFGENTGIACKLALPEEGLALEPEQAAAIFRILQESLNNVAKHAQASKVNIRFANQGGAMSMEVEDNGLGFEPGAREGSFGLIGIRERALMAGGKARINSAPGKGTRIQVYIPGIRSGRSPQEHIVS